MVKPNSFSLLRWGLFFHPGPTLPSWARITYLSLLLPLQPGRGNHTSLTSQRPKSTACILHTHSQGWFHGRRRRRRKALILAKSSLTSPDLEPHVGAVLMFPFQFWTTFLHLWGEMWARAYSKLCFRSSLVGCDLIWIPKKDKNLLSILIHANVFFLKLGDVIGMWNCWANQRISTALLFWTVW